MFKKNIVNFSIVFLLSTGIANAFDSKTVQVAISGDVKSNTCTPDVSGGHVNVLLHDINATSLEDYAQDFNVILKGCGSTVSAVSVLATGTADTTKSDYFKNSGKSAGIAVKLEGGVPDKVVMKPSLVPALYHLEAGDNTLTFKVTPVKTGVNDPTAGALSSTVTLQFTYS